jgi:hypothetical protein
MKLLPEECVLTGTWLFEHNENRGDSVCKRIEWLINNHLQRVASSPQWGDWEVLYVDPSDGRHWELTFPLGHMQGGGPPQICVVTDEVAQAKYSTEAN